MRPLPRLLLPALAVAACSTPLPDGAALSRQSRAADRELRQGERVPDAPEATAVGALEDRVARGTTAFARLVRCEAPDIVFKDEEGTAADRMMTPRLRARLTRLAGLVAKEWPDLRLRVTEAWDERGEHGRASVHYEGRAADLTTSDVDPAKLGRLARLAVDAGLDWVFFEDASHVHVSVTR